MLLVETPSLMCAVIEFDIEQEGQDMAVGACAHVCVRSTTSRHKTSRIINQSFTKTFVFHFFLLSVGTRSFVVEKILGFNTSLLLETLCPAYKRESEGERERCG